MSQSQTKTAGMVPDRVLRHRWETPMLAICGVITIAAFAASIYVFLFMPEAGDSETEGSIREMLQGAAFLPLLALVILVTRYFMAAGLRSGSVKAGPEQFPELYAMHVSLAEKLGLARIPDLYVANGNGVVNAYAFACDYRRRYVVVHAEIARLVDDYPDVVAFVIAHELGHHKLGHVRWWRNVIGIIPGGLIFPGRAMVRAQEYSADRVATTVCNQCSQGIGLLSVGPYLQHRVSSGPYMAQAVEEEKSWFVRFANWVADHSVNTKRYLALRAIEEHGLDRHGPLFL